MSNNNVDRYTRMGQAGKITRAEAQRRREQSRLARAIPALVAPARPLNTVVRRQESRIPAGYRRSEVWMDWMTNTQEGGLYVRSTRSMCPASALFRTVGDLDHILVEVMVEMLPATYDPNLMHASMAMGLWRYAETVPDNEDDQPAAAIPVDIRRYAGSQDIVLVPGGPMIRWSFKPRSGDRVDSLDLEKPALHLCVHPRVVLLRPPVGEPLEFPNHICDFRIGATYWVRDRQGLLY